MKNTKICIVALVLIFSSILRSEDDFINCNVNESKIVDEPNSIPLSGLIIDGKSEFLFCYDFNAASKNKELDEEFKLLDVLGFFDQKGCVINIERSESENLLLKKFIAKNISEKVNIYAAVNPVSKQANVIYSNTDNTNFVNNALTTKDKWHIAGFAATTIAVGGLISEKLYAGQADKRKHWTHGAVISGLTTGSTYFLLETAGLGDKLGLSKKQKKLLIMLSGPLMGTLAGIVKEGLDDRDRKHHTVDVNDAIATSLGAGAAMFSISIPL